MVLSIIISEYSTTLIIFHTKLFPILSKNSNLLENILKLDISYNKNLTISSLLKLFEHEDRFEKLESLNLSSLPINN